MRRGQEEALGLHLMAEHEEEPLGGGSLFPRRPWRGRALRKEAAGRELGAGVKEQVVQAGR